MLRLLASSTELLHRAARKAFSNFQKVRKLCLTRLCASGSEICPPLAGPSGKVKLAPKARTDAAKEVRSSPQRLTRRTHVDNDPITGVRRQNTKPVTKKPTTGTTRSKPATKPAVMKKAATTTKPVTKPKTTTKPAAAAKKPTTGTTTKKAPVKKAAAASAKKNAITKKAASTTKKSTTAKKGVAKKVSILLLRRIFLVCQLINGNDGHRLWLVKLRSLLQRPRLNQGPPARM